jgi:hypothetical protein
MAASTGSARAQTTPAVMADQANMGTRRSVRPGARSVSTVVATDTQPNVRATSTAISDRRNSSTPAASVPPGPPSTR